MSLRFPSFSVASLISLVLLCGGWISAQTAPPADAEAQYQLGLKYQQGNGVRQSHSRAFDLFRKAAEQGNSAAQNAAGVAYATGNGVQQDKAEALKWYRSAAKQGYAAALFNVGTAYYNGDGIQADFVKAYA
ncbi:MAG: sel1 repeat family protein, partial [Acidobacteriales bacterium]|nr:sel1 repeat family protein [Terriglobales bacterium]